MTTIRFVPALLFLFLFVAACGNPQEEPSSDATTAENAPTSEAVTAALAELPPAIKGEGGELEGQSVAYFPVDAATTGYLAVPDGEGPFPALVIIHEWNGLTDRVRQVADDFAAEGYVTLAADLYQGRTGTNRDENIALMTEANENMPVVIENLNAAVAFLKERSDVTGRVGAMGWCFGGGIALSFGLDGDNHDATAIFYGRLIDDPEALAHVDHEIYGTFARLDRGPAPEAVEAFEAALDAAGLEHDLHIYDDVNHGFWLRVDEEPDVRAVPAADAWNRLKNYLNRTLGD